MTENPILIDTLSSVVAWLATGLLALLVWIVRRIFLYSKRIEMLEQAKEDDRKQREKFREEVRTSLGKHNDDVLKEIKDTRNTLSGRIDDIMRDRANH